MPSLRHGVPSIPRRLLTGGPLQSMNREGRRKKKDIHSSHSEPGALNSAQPSKVTSHQSRGESARGPKYRGRAK